MQIDHDNEELDKNFIFSLEKKRREPGKWRIYEYLCSNRSTPLIWTCVQVRMKYLTHIFPLKPKGKEETNINSIRYSLLFSPPFGCLTSNYNFWLQPSNKMIE